MIMKDSHLQIWTNYMYVHVVTAHMLTLHNGLPLHTTCTLYQIVDLAKFWFDRLRVAGLLMRYGRGICTEKSKARGLTAPLNSSYWTESPR